MQNIQLKKTEKAFPQVYAAINELPKFRELFDAVECVIKKAKTDHPDAAWPSTVSCTATYQAAAP